MTERRTCPPLKCAPERAQPLGVATFLAAGLLAAGVACTGCRPPPPPKGPSIKRGKPAKQLPAEPSVRVALARNRRRAILGCASGGEVWAGPPGRKVMQGQRIGVEVVSGPRGFLVNGRQVTGQWVLVKPKGQQVQVADKAFPGEAYVVKEPRGLTVVNSVPMERYLCGVVGNEMKPSWPAEALKAQAIAARTYVLFQMRWSRRSAYHVVSTATDQRYAGGRVDLRVSAAVAATRGLALTRQGSVIPAYYHSTCGGHTGCAADVFGLSHLAFLKGVPCAYCANSPHAEWRTRVTTEELCRALSRPKRPVAHITALQALDRSGDGRPKTIRVFMGPKEADFKARDFRRALGTYRIKSTRFVVETARGGFRLKGKGFGHGAGMCQYGARGMADAGARAGQILAKYYAETRLAALYK